MALTPKNLYRGSPTGSSTTLYTAPSDGYAIIKEIIVCNVAANDVTLTLNTVASGGSVAGSNRILSTFNVLVGETLTFPLSTVLGPSETLRGLASAGSSIALTVSGVEGR